MIGFPAEGGQHDTFRRTAGLQTEGEGRAWSLPDRAPALPRNTPRTTVPGVTARVVAGIGVGIVPEGFDDQYAELDALVCRTCGGTQVDPDWPMDRYGNLTPCPECEDWGH